MRKSPKLATPLTAATLVVPPRVAPPGLLPNDTDTVPVNAGTGFPAGSSAVTWTAGVIVWPATVVAGWPVNATCVAEPGLIAKDSLVAPVSPDAATVSARTARATRRMRERPGTG